MIEKKIFYNTGRFHKLQLFFQLISGTEIRPKPMNNKHVHFYIAKLGVKPTK